MHVLGVRAQEQQACSRLISANADTSKEGQYRDTHPELITCICSSLTLHELAKNGRAYLEHQY